MLKASLVPRVAVVGAALVLPFVAAASARAAAGAAADSERAPVNLDGGGSHAAHVGGSGSIVRTIVGLAIVIGVIYGVAWVLKQVKQGREGGATGSGLASVASVPLGSGRSVHLVRAGCELVLVGVAEQGVTPLRTYTLDEAQAAGLIDEGGEALPPVIEADAPRRPRLALPRPRLALPAPRRTTARPATGANLLDTLRAWTVRA